MLIGLAAVATLAAVNVAIWQKEALIAEGRPVYVELAPVDPRSLIQGDYMRLNFRLPEDIEHQLDALVTRQRPHVVASLLRIESRGAGLAADEFRVAADGPALLVGMVDAALVPIKP